MIEQYKKETSQIHVPSDLILRTKQAVQEEEKRIQQETALRNAVVHSPKTSNGKVHRWAFTVAAAALFVLFGTSAIVLGDRVNKSGMSGSADTGMMDSMAGAADMEASMPDMVTESTGIDSPEQSSDSINAGLPKPTVESADTGAISGEEFSGGAAASGSMDLDDMYESDSDGYAAVSDELEEEKKYADYEEACKEMGNNRIGLSIVKVDEIPSFYDNPDTEYVVLHGTAFYVTKEQGAGWSAYVCVDGENYVIVGGTDEIANQEIFVEEAYQLLTEKMGGTE